MGIGGISLNQNIGNRTDTEFLSFGIYVYPISNTKYTYMSYTFTQSLKAALYNSFSGPVFSPKPKHEVRRTSHM